MAVCPRALPPAWCGVGDCRMFAASFFSCWFLGHPPWDSGSPILVVRGAPVVLGLAVGSHRPWGPSSFTSLQTGARKMEERHRRGPLASPAWDGSHSQEATGSGSPKGVRESIVLGRAHAGKWWRAQPCAESPWCARVPGRGCWRRFVAACLGLELTMAQDRFGGQTWCRPWGPRHLSGLYCGHWL